MEFSVHIAGAQYLEDSDKAQHHAPETAGHEPLAAPLQPSAAQSLAFLQVF